MAEVQGYAFLALKILAGLLNDQAYKKLAKQLKDNFLEKFWLENEKFFALALDGQDLKRQAITSNPGHLLFCGILEKKLADLVVKKLFSRDLWTDYGIRTLSVNDLDFDETGYHLGSVWPHDNWIIAQGLKNGGYLTQYEKIKRAILTAFEKLNSIPELFGVNKKGELLKINKACIIQAWSSAAALNFIKD